MEYKVRIDQLIYAVEREFQSQEEYVLASKKWHRTSILNPTAYAEASNRSRMAHESYEREKECVRTASDILGISGYSYERLYSAARSYLRFCKRNNWERLPREETFEALGRFIFTEPKELAYDWVPGYLKRRKERMTNAKA